MNPKQNIRFIKIFVLFIISSFLLILLSCSSQRSINYSYVMLSENDTIKTFFHPFEMIKNGNYLAIENMLKTFEDTSEKRPSISAYLPASIHNKPLEVMYKDSKITPISKDELKKYEMKFEDKLLVKIKEKFQFLKNFTANGETIVLEPIALNFGQFLYYGSQQFNTTEIQGIKPVWFWLTIWMVKDRESDSSKCFFKISNDKIVF
jgi:hypothetical protein